VRHVVCAFSDAGGKRTRPGSQDEAHYVAGELAAMRVPVMELDIGAAPETLKTVGERWRESRVDVADATAITHRTNLARILKHVGDRPVANITAADVARFVADLHRAGAARESIRKTLATFAWSSTSQGSRRTRLETGFW
jgi:hypothetical protein